MQSNLINNYVQRKNIPAFNSSPKNTEEVEIITKRKAKPHFDINRELANRTFIKPLPPKGHLVNDGFMSAPAVFVNDLAYDMKALKAAWSGDANDHQLGKLNDLGMKLGGLGIATYLSTIKAAPVAKGMEFVGLVSFFASMAIWPKIALELPARLIHGFNPFMRYEDSQGRKKPFFQDNQYLAYDMIPDKMIDRVGNRTGIPKNLPNRRDAVQDKMRQIALQNNTMWMLTAGFATPVLSSLLCNVLEPHVANIYNYHKNRKIDNILVNFAAAQEKYKPKSINKDLTEFLELYKGRVINDDMLLRLSEVLTQELNPKVAIGVHEDLKSIFLKDSNRVLATQINPLRKVITETVSKSSKDNAVIQNVQKIVPSLEQMSVIFDKYNGKNLSVSELRDLKSEITDAISANIKALEQQGVHINKNSYNKIIRGLYGKKELEAPIMSILTSSPANVLDDEAQKLMLNISDKMTKFCAENNALSMYSYQKIASAPDTAKAIFWNKISKSLLDVLKVTPAEIANARYDRTLVAKLINRKMQAIVSDDNAYQEMLTNAAAKFSEVKRYVKPDDMTGRYINQLENTCKSAAEAFEQLGFKKTAERIIGKNGNEAGSLLGISRFFVSDNVADLNNTFARFFNTANLYRSAYKDPNLDELKSLSKTSLSKEIKEEIFALSEFLSTSGRISDYSVKFEFLRNPKPNVTDMSGLSFNDDGTIKYMYYNKQNLENSAVTLQNDTGFYKRVMNFMFGGELRTETNSALVEYPYVQKMLTEYRHNMLHKVGDMECFMFPSRVVHDAFNNNDRIYSSVTPNEANLMVGSALDDMFTNSCKRAFNTKKWFKIFGGFGAGLFGVTVLSQFFFGKNGKVQNSK